MNSSKHEIDEVINQVIEKEKEEVLREIVMNKNVDMEDNLAATMDKDITQPRRSKRVSIPSKRLADFVLKPDEKNMTSGAGKQCNEREFVTSSSE